MINTACNHDAVALAEFIQYHDAIQAQKPYDPVADKDAIRDISAIAAGISVAQAAKSSSIHPRECQMTRSNNAVHEAAHVVIDTVYKRWVTSIFIPTLGSDGKVMRANLHEHEGQGTASSYSTPRPDRNDPVVLLEDAVSYCAGIVMEQVLQGCSQYDIAGEAKSDYINANSSLLAFQAYIDGRRGNNKTMPGSVARAQRAARARSARAHALLYQEMYGIALILISKEFQLIDAVAAIILSHGVRGGTMWSPRHQHWLSSELRLDAKQRTCALRTPHIPLPQWLKTLAMRGAPSDFTSQRAKLHAYGF